jgi:hypothetical protein
MKIKMLGASITLAIYIETVRNRGVMHYLPIQTRITKGGRDLAPVGMAMQETAIAKLGIMSEYDELQKREQQKEIWYVQ